MQNKPRPALTAALLTTWQFLMLLLVVLTAVILWNSLALGMVLWLALTSKELRGHLSEMTRRVTGTRKESSEGSVNSELP